MHSTYLKDFLTWEIFLKILQNILIKKFQYDTFLGLPIYYALM